MPLTLASGLIEDAKSGGAGLEQLIMAVWPEAYRIAFSILRDRGLAEDAAQESCASIARALSAFKNSGAFPAWSYRIIVNHAITAARRRPRTRDLDALTDQTVHFDQSDALDLYKALEELPAVQRGAIILHYYAGLDSREIAAATAMPRSTVRFHLMLARRALRKALSTAEAHTLKNSAEPHTIKNSKEALSDVHR